MKWYTGMKDGKLTAFRSDNEPTQATHGKLYTGCIGPFITKRAAKWSELHAMRNPHAQTVAQMERLAKCEA